MLNPLQVAVVELVQEKALELPAAQRIKIYRGMADFIQDPNVARKFVQRAMILEAAEAKCLKLKIQFQRKDRQ